MSRVELILAAQALAGSIAFLCGVALADSAVRARAAIRRILAELRELGR